MSISTDYTEAEILREAKVIYGKRGHKARLAKTTHEMFQKWGAMGGRKSKRIKKPPVQS